MITSVYETEKNKKRLESAIVRLRTPYENPTVRALARSLSLRQQDILDLAEWHRGMDILIGFGIPGFGYNEEENIGDYRIELYQSDYQ